MNRTTVLLTLVILLTGCARIAPEIIQASGNDYNIAMQRTRDEQMLLNLVRLKYRDTPFFLEVGSVSSQFKLSSGASLSANFKEQQIPENVGIGGNINFTEQPTITYTPLQGDDFVQRLLSPVSLETILLLANSGWSLDRVLRLCVQGINEISNAPTASGPTPTHIPEYEAFLELTDLLGSVKREGLIRLGYASTEDPPVPVLLVNTRTKDDPRIVKIQERLELSRDELQYALLAGADKNNNRNNIIITTRSLLGIMFYLSHSVIAPDSDKISGAVTVTRDENGAEFDWTELTRGLFRIQSGNVPAGNAAIETYYRGSWFYIDDTDLDSKSTFSLLIQLFSLQAGKAEGLKPVLTLPIGS